MHNSPEPYGGRRSKSPAEPDPRGQPGTLLCSMSLHSKVPDNTHPVLLSSTTGTTQPPSNGNSNHSQNLVAALHSPKAHRQQLPYLHTSVLHSSTFLSRM